MASCERCWRTANLRARTLGGSVTDHYTKIVAEREGQCTAEDQAGTDATVCGACGRRAVHEVVRDCMACGANAYATWIAAYRERHPDLTSLCDEATREMREAFPELRRARGHVRMREAPDGDTRPWPHWWLVEPLGEIVDPTRAQFPGPIDYDEHDESQGEPSGVCPNCSGLVYDGGTCCSDRCHDEYARYVMGCGE